MVEGHSSEPRSEALGRWSENINKHFNIKLFDTLRSPLLALRLLLSLPLMATGRIILSEQKLNLVLDRLSHQLIEYHGDFSNTCIVGIQPRGTALSDRLMERLRGIARLKSIEYGLLDVTFHRDDFRTRQGPLKASEMKMDFLVDGKKVILVDDVLYTGRTIQAAISTLQHFGRPEKIELLVLVDRRFNRDLPIQSDYSGMELRFPTPNR